MKRIFIAVDPPLRADTLEPYIKQRLPKLVPSLRFVKPDQHHITLAFLAGTRNGDLGKVYAALHRVAGRYQPLQLVINGWLAFPSFKQARVLGLGITSKPLLQLTKDVATELRRSQLRPDTKPYIPHLTVARVRGSQVVDLSRLQTMDLSELKPYTVRELAVFESVPTNAGFIHQTIKKFPL